MKFSSISICLLLLLGLLAQGQGSDPSANSVTDTDTTQVDGGDTDVDATGDQDNEGDENSGTEQQDDTEGDQDSDTEQQEDTEGDQDSDTEQEEDTEGDQDSDTEQQEDTEEDEDTGGDEPAVCLTPASGFPHNGVRWFWLELEFHDCCHPNDNPTEAEVVSLLDNMSDWLLAHMRELQQEMNGDQSSTISEVRLRLVDYDTCIFPPTFAEDPDFWCQVELDVTHWQPLVAEEADVPDILDVDIWQFFISATEEQFLQKMIRNFFWKYEDENLPPVLTLNNGRQFNEWQLIELIGLGGTPCNPNRSGKDGGSSASATWEEQLAAITADEDQDQEIEDILGSSACSTTVTPLTMILATAWMLGNWFF